MMLAELEEPRCDVTGPADLFIVKLGGEVTLQYFKETALGCVVLLCILGCFFGSTDFWFPMWFLTWPLYFRAQYRRIRLQKQGHDA